MGVKNWSPLDITRVVCDNITRIMKVRGINKDIKVYDPLTENYVSICTLKECLLEGDMCFFLSVVISISKELGVSPLVLFREHKGR